MPATGNEGWPSWIGWATTGGVAVIGVLVVTSSIASSRKPVAAAALCLALIAAWAWCQFAHSEFVLNVRAAVALGLVAALSWWVNNQLALMFFINILGETAATSRKGRTLAVTGAAFAIVAVGPIFDPEQRESWVYWMVGLAFGVLAGRMMYAQTRTVADLHAAQARLAETAAADERRRIAREVHDVVAHSLAVVMLHVTGARMALRDGEVVEADGALAEAEVLGRRSLGDIRRTVGLLRTDDHAALQPLPDALSVPALVDGFHAAGLAVAYQQSGELGRVSETAGLAIYRIIQEALTNAAKHARACRAAVKLEIDAEGGVEAKITSFGAPRPGPPGHGIAGMRERAAAIGGTVDAGLGADGFAVVCRLPAAVAVP